jgi:outer membrane protein OmpA-like peptidoglycan-associated protein
MGTQEVVCLFQASRTCGEILMKAHNLRLATAALGLLLTSTALSTATPGLPLKANAGGHALLAQVECKADETPEACAARKAQEPAAPAEKPAQEEPAPAPEAPAPEEPAPAPEQPAPEAPAEQPAPEPEAPAAPAPEAPAAPAPEAPAAPAPEAPAAPAPEAPAAPAPEAPAPEQPAAGSNAPAEQPAPSTEAPAEQPAAKPEAPATPAPEAPATTAPAAPATEAPAPAPQTPQAEQPGPAQSGEAAPADGSAAPVLDSQKRRPRDGSGQQAAEPATPAQPPAPPPADDRAAQEAVQPAEVVPLTREEGTRRERAPEARDRERPQGVEVIGEAAEGRVIIRFGTDIFVDSDERPRLGRGAREVYYEDLPSGRVREVIVRENGVQVITIRNRYGDVIRRSRIMPDGREYVLVYVDDSNYERVRDWRDPGLDLPPMQLTIPVEEYILEAEEVSTPDQYYEFLSEPPVERVERLYSVDEVKRSARIRDKTRRIDLDTITFEFGKATIAQSEVPRLEGIAKAIQRMLEANPAETFLIEGHTDAVGTDEANLGLSDQRAEAVAAALTDVFSIPAENLSTQGYGEQYLKVQTESEERQNRRVAIRRITPLVAPVASAN